MTRVKHGCERRPFLRPKQRPNKVHFTTVVQCTSNIDEGEFNFCDKRWGIAMIFATSSLREWPKGANHAAQHRVMSTLGPAVKESLRA